MRKFSQTLLSGSNPMLKLQTGAFKTSPLTKLNVGFSVNKSNLRYFASNKDGKNVKDIKPTENQVAKSKVSIIQSAQSDIASLSLKEIQNLNDNITTQTGDDNEAAQWISKSGYTLNESEQEIVLNKTDKAYSVSLKFSPYPEEDGVEDDTLDGDNKDFTDSDAEDKSDESGSDSDKELDESQNQPKPRPLTLRAEVTFNNMEGSPKGIMVINGEVSADNRIYINQLQALPVTSDKKVEKIPDLPFSMFEGLSQDIQDRIYDLLDEVGIDDKMGSYIRFYSNTFEDRQSVSVLQNLNKIFSN